MTKDILYTLANALLSSGSVQPEESTQKWFMCVSDRQGGVQTYEAHNIFHAETMVREWLAAGWPAWIQSDDGRVLTIATQPKELN